MVKEIQGCPAKTAISVISAISPKIAKNWRNRMFLPKLIKSSITGGRRVSSKSCDFCNFSKNCEKLEKSQFLLKLIKSSGTGSRRVSSKNCNFCIFCDFSKNCEKLEKLQFLLKLIKSSVTGGRRVSSKNCDFCNFSKNWKKIGEIAVFAKIN